MAPQNYDVATCPRSCLAANKYRYEVPSGHLEVGINKSQIIDMKCENYNI